MLCQLLLHRGRLLSWWKAKSPTFEVKVLLKILRLYMTDECGHSHKARQTRSVARDFAG